ncbi:interleukin-37-like isoform X1 [Marmota flaviventris]|uniref:interleukin-37-like isoform X1 n=1 Tax=Marmota flaviventris TaxID=93162 RepID=UPI003A8B6EDB
MFALGGISEVDTNRGSCMDQDESQPVSEGRGPLLLDLGPAFVASTHSGSRIKSVTCSKFLIRDPNQQVLVLEGGVLKAVPDKHTRTGEIFCIATSEETSSISSGSTTKANHIFLAVCKGKLCLCCDKVKEPKCPLLELKNKNIRELNSLDKEHSLPFTFVQEMVGSYFTLESAANPGYFIYTSKTPMQPVGMTKEPGKENNTQFKFQIANADLNSTHSG